MTTRRKQTDKQREIESRRRADREKRQHESAERAAKDAAAAERIQAKRSADNEVQKTKFHRGANYQRVLTEENQTRRTSGHRDRVALESIKTQQYAARQQAKLQADIANRELKRQEREANTSDPSGPGITSKIPSVRAKMGGPSEQVQSASTTITGGIFRIFGVMIGMSLLYLMVATPKGNPGQSGATFISSVGSFLTNITSGQPLFVSK